MISPSHHDIFTLDRERSSILLFKLLSLVALGHYLSIAQLILPSNFQGGSSVYDLLAYIQNNWNLELYMLQTLAIAKTNHPALDTNSKGYSYLPMHYASQLW